MTIKRILAALLAMAALLAALAGCTRVTIREDSVYEALPPVDPDDGVYQEQNVNVYFRQKGQTLLLNDTRAVTVRPNESQEMAIMRALIQGPPANSVSHEAIVPQGTRLITMSFEDRILYVTLSVEFITGSLGGDTEEDAALLRRLSVYAVVNSLLAAGNADRVLILIDVDGKGVGARLRRLQFGFIDDPEQQMQFVEPLEFEPEVLAQEAWLPGGGGGQ